MNTPLLSKCRSCNAYEALILPLAFFEFATNRLGIVKRYDTLPTFLVTRDTHLLQEQAALPEAMREKLTICHPTEFLKGFRKR